MEENKKKTGLIIALLVIIVALIVLLFFVMNKKTSVNVINNKDNTNPAKNGETVPAENNTGTTDPTTENNTGNNTGTQTTTKLDENGVKKLHGTLISNVDVGYGLYFERDHAKITIDDVNNPYLIAFNLKKYLAEKLGVTSDNEFKWPKEGTWSWDGCINTSCEEEEGTEFTKLYRVSKKDFNDYMHKTYNTTKDYDLKKADEGLTSGIVGDTIVVDSGSEYYNILLIPKSGRDATIKTEITKYEEDDNYLYIYDKVIYCEGGFGSAACYYDVLPSPSELPNTIEECSEENEKDCEVEKAFNENKNGLITYKHTFKKANGNYYWVNTDFFKSSNY